MYTLDPWIVRWEQALQQALILPSEKRKYFVKLNVDGLLRGDYVKRMAGYSTARQNGWLSANDIRELEDLNPITGGDVYLVNGNMVKAENKINNGGGVPGVNDTEEDKNQNEK